MSGRYRSNEDDAATYLAAARAGAANVMDATRRDALGLATGNDPNRRSRRIEETRRDLYDHMMMGEVRRAAARLHVEKEEIESANESMMRNNERRQTAWRETAERASKAQRVAEAETNRLRREVARMSQELADHKATHTCKVKKTVKKRKEKERAEIRRQDRLEAIIVAAAAAPEDEGDGNADAGRPQRRPRQPRPVVVTAAQGRAGRGTRKGMFQGSYKV